MLLKIDHLRVLILGNRSPDYENIRQHLSDGLHCPVFFDSAAVCTGLDVSAAGREYHVILVDGALPPPGGPDIIGRAAASGIPVVYLVDAFKFDVSIELIDRGVSACIPKDEPDRLAAAVYKMLAWARAETALRDCVRQALRLLSALEDADRHKYDFISALSHELRNPLASIVAGLSLLDMLDRNPTTRRTKDLMRRQTERLRRLADGLLTLARAAGNQDEAPRDHEAPESISSKPLRILLIDDNRDLVETSRALLTLYGYHVAAAYTGADGIEKAREFLPHVILCDIGLPDMDGYEVARRLAGCRELAGSRLISLSGYAQPAELKEGAAAGFDLHISKPVDFERLKQILDALIQ
ncbi:His Kinase A (phospho-acceptor) domain-containing protein [Sporobacter termitidis DSM 10068]|uniref:Stage 0 sporulation protein A homolog n=1 Tax=Sporobacter termitidis DSM 10068 TaxID=1123282 RepID=A0A1M5XK61_9FIRM|nr:response regulator [Sporobacter termitidis]SHI00139.1 His Kinase A (phospho-acceptor) domain-containing protein [Sporobacter termitidis DSM 10068]